MAFNEQFALWRAPYFCAIKTSFRQATQQLYAWVKARNHPHIGQLSPHLTRDAGVDPSHMEPRTHRLPSQHTHHPRG